MVWKCLFHSLVNKGYEISSNKYTSSTFLSCVKLHQECRFFFQQERSWFNVSTKTEKKRTGSLMPQQTGFFKRTMRTQETQSAQEQRQITFMRSSDSEPNKTSHKYNMYFTSSRAIDQENLSPTKMQKLNYVPWPKKCSYAMHTTERKVISNQTWHLWQLFTLFQATCCVPYWTISSLTKWFLWNHSNTDQISTKIYKYSWSDIPRRNLWTSCEITPVKRTIQICNVTIQTSSWCCKEKRQLTCGTSEHWRMAISKHVLNICRPRDIFPCSYLQTSPLLTAFSSFVFSSPNQCPSCP